MFDVQIDKGKNLLTISFSRHVTPDETSQWRIRLQELLAELSPGFKLLSDFSQLDLMDFACAPDIEFGMELCNKASISKVIRIIPDPRKDIGFNIMSRFHYRRGIIFVTCDTMEQALQALGD